MKVEELPFASAFVVHGTESSDERGTFTRLVEFADVPYDFLTRGYLAAAHNIRRGTVRGLHFQAEPYAEAKIVWCSTGSVYDVLVDVRPDQPTYGTWISVELSALMPTSVFVPPGVAHGYQTLSEHSTVSYLIDGPREVAGERAINWSDPELNITWPLPLADISARDATAPSLSSLNG